MASQKRKKSVLLWLTKTAGRTQLQIILLMLMEALLGICAVYQAVQLGFALNAAAEGRQQTFVITALAFAALLIVQILLSALHIRLSERAVSTMENNMKKRLFDCLLRKDYASVTAVHSGDWMNRLTGDTAVVADGLTRILPKLAGALVRLAAALAAILWLEPKSLYLLVPGAVIILLVVYLCGSMSIRRHKRIQQADDSLRQFQQARLNSMLVVRSFAGEQDSLHQAEELMKEHQSARMKRNGVSVLFHTGCSAVLSCVYLLGVIWCGYSLLKGTMQFGSVVSVLILTGQMQNPLAGLSGLLSRYYGVIAGAERLMEAESFGEDSSESEQEQAVQKFYTEEFKSLGLKNACFTYRNPLRGGEEAVSMPQVISDLSMEVRKGQLVALTGPAGCGKSTVLKLLMCLYPLDGGARYMQGGDREWPLSARWRRLFAYVPQRNQLLSGTVREVMAFGDREKMNRTEELWQALKIAGADEFVRALDSGLDTQLDAHGTNLTEGQLQQIAIARAVFSGHPILLLDGATAALDSETEAKLLENLRTMTDTTVLIVTDRSETLAAADAVIDFGSKAKEEE